MRRAVTQAQYRALAEFRYHIREFLRGSEIAADKERIEPQQYQMLLAIRGLPPDQVATIRVLADQLLLRHHSAVELTDRLETHGYVSRTRSKEDRRQVIVSLRPKGERVLERIARVRLEELHTRGRELVKALTALLEESGRARKKGSRSRNPKKR